MLFVFYDLETTGISPAFDQPLQFAAILTDGEFREIERVTQLRHLKLEIGRFLACGSHNFKGLVSAAAKVV